MLPTLPDTAPFTAEQRGWLNGYIAARFGNRGGGFQPPGPSEESASSQTTAIPVTILWGSQTGNAEGLAKKLSKSLAAAGHQPIVHDMAAFEADTLASLETVIIITSTYGDGEPPDNAGELYDFLRSDDAPGFDTTRFAVFGLGDSEYPDFCECARQFDSRLAILGADRLLDRVDADVDYDEPFKAWEAQLLESLTAVPA